MATTTASAGEKRGLQNGSPALKNQIYQSILRLSDWLEKNDYRGYDTFDGLSSKLLRPLTFNSKFLRTVLQQGVRRLPINIRPLIGIGRSQSTKGMGFLARGFMRMNECNGDKQWDDKANFALHWLMDHRSGGYHGSCWGNHFDYQSRGFYLAKGTPTIVWTSLIGHAFLDGYVHFGNNEYLDVAVSACEHILADLSVTADGKGACISYIPTMDCHVHNANTLGGSLLARTYSITHKEAYRELAEKAIAYTAQYQQQDGAWWYGERADMHWVDNFHTAYVLDCFKYYGESLGDHRFDETMMHGYNYWKNTFFLADGTPKYYKQKMLPLDIQCCSQAIDTLVFFADRDPEGIALAIKVAEWTIANMQDSSGYFYYRRYTGGIINRTPTLHWGQATMLSALSGLYKQLCEEKRPA